MVGILGDAIFANTWHTAQHALLGLGLSVMIAIAVIGVYCVAPASRQPLVVFGVITKVSPAIAYAPLLLILVGIGSSVKVLTAALFCFYPLLIEPARAFDRFPARLEAFAFTYDSTVLERVRIYGWAFLTEALCRALATAAPLAVIGSIVADYVMAGTRPGGIGQAIMRASNYGDAKDLLLYASISTLLGVSAYGLAEWLSNWVHKRLRLKRG